MRHPSSPKKVTMWALTAEEASHQPVLLTYHVPGADNPQAPVGIQFRVALRFVTGKTAVFSGNELSGPKVSLQVKTMNIILSVDDESGILQVRHMILEQAGYQVLDASDGEAALRVFGTADIDLVLLDYFMPQMDGGAVATEMKRTKPQVPVIMVSASLECFEIVRGKVDSFVCKGYGPELLLAEIKKFLAIERHYTEDQFAA